MSFQIALCSLFAGSVLLVFALRWYERERYERFEILVTAWESELSAFKANSPGLYLRLLGLFQALAFLGLAVRNTVLTPDPESSRAKIESQLKECFDHFKAALKTPQSDTVQAAIQNAHDLRAQFINQLTPTNLFQQQSEYSLGDTEQDSGQAMAPATVQIENLDEFVSADSENNWDHEAWQAIEQGCRRLQHLHWSFNQVELGPEVTLLQERMSLMLQSWGPLWAQFLHFLTPEDQQIAREDLTKLTTAHAQVIFNAQLFWRLSQNTEGESFSVFQPLVIELTKGAIDQLAGGLSNLGSDLFRSISEFSTTNEHSDSDVKTKAMTQLRKLRQASESLAQKGLEWGAEHISYDWLVIEAIYGHPRGLDLVRDKELKCFGCIAIKSESLSHAEVVHGFKKGVFLKYLQQGEPLSPPPVAEVSAQ